MLAGAGQRRPRHRPVRRSLPTAAETR